MVAQESDGQESLHQSFKFLSKGVSSFWLQNLHSILSRSHSPIYESRLLRSATSPEKADISSGEVNSCFDLSHLKSDLGLKKQIQRFDFRGVRRMAESGGGGGWRDSYRGMSSDNIKGLVLAISSSLFIGASFIVKKKGLKKAGATGTRAGTFLHFKQRKKLVSLIAQDRGFSGSLLQEKRWSLFLRLLSTDLIYWERNFKALRLSLC